MPTANEIIEKRKKALESGVAAPLNSMPKVRTIDDVLADRGYRTPESIQAAADAQERSVLPVTVNKPAYSDAVEAQRLSAASSISKTNMQPAKPITGMPSKATVPQMSYTDFKKQEYVDIPSIVAGKTPATHERANIRPAVIGNKNVADNQPSWGKTIGSSLLGGVAQTQSSMFNIPRKVIEGVSIGLDKVLPKFIYSKEMQENDPIKKALDKAVQSNEERAMQYQKNLEGTKGLKNFVATGLNSLPQIVLAAVGGVAAQGGSALASLPEAARQLIPFGTLAAGGYAKEAENEGATYGQQVAYGLLGGTAEAATEVIPLGNALELMKKFGAGEIAEKGAKTLIGKYGKTALKIIGNLLEEGIQEGIMSPLSNTAKKITYKPEMPLTGEGGIIDLKAIGKDAYGGIAMGVILGGLGLPSSYASYKIAAKMIESEEPITPEAIQNELMPALQKDVTAIDNESNQAANIQQAPAEFNWALNQVMTGKNIPAALEAKYPVLVEFRKNLQSEGKETQPESLQEPTAKVEDKQVETIVEQGIEPVMNIGYHAGNLGKAEHFGRQYGSGRDTGHFGTGTYFVGDKKKIDLGGYKERPLHEVEFDGYNLYKPKDEKTARKLHDLLKFTNRYYSTAKGNLISDELLNDLEYSEPDVVISELKKLGKWDEEKFQDYFKVSSDEYIDKKLERPDISKYLENDLLRGIKQDNEKIQRALNYRSEFEEVVEDVLGISKEKANEILDGVYADIEKQFGSSDRWTMNKDLDKSDSVSTRLMKALGYEGVDVRHIPNYDNTGYGSVIYDLKENNQQKATAEASQEPTAKEKPQEAEIVDKGDKEPQKQGDKEATRLSEEELENRISDITRELSKLESDLRNPRTLDKQKVREKISELETKRGYLSARVSKLVKDPKGNKAKLQNALINEQLTFEGIEISKGKKHGFDHEQREQIAEELIEGSKTDKEKINIKVRNDGTMNVINSEATIADVMDKLGIKKIETKIPYNIDKNVSTRIIADEKNMMVTPDGYYAVYVTAEELQALKELAADKQIEYKTDFKFDDLIKSSENNTIELTDIPKLYKAGRISYYYFKAGDTIYCFDKKLVDIFNKDGNRFYVGGKNTQPATIKDSEGNTIGILLPVRSKLSQAEINSLNPATGKDFFPKSKQRKPKQEDIDEKLTPYDTPEIIQARKEAANIKPTSDINTPERQALRREIADKLLNIGSFTEKKGKETIFGGEVKADKIVYIVMGPPAAGKSSVFANRLSLDNKALIVDCDMAKERLDEFNDGYGAGVVHQESSDITEKYVTPQAMAKGYNIVLPIVGKKASTVRKYRDLFNSVGYEVHLCYNELPPEKAAQRAITRFLEEHRFVDPDYVLNDVGWKPKEVYDIMKSEGGFKSYEKYSNDVPKDEPAKFIERIENPNYEQERAQVQRNPMGRDNGGRTPEGNTKGSRIDKTDGEQRKEPSEEVNYSPTQKVANYVRDKLTRGNKFTFIDLTKAADEAYGGTQAQNIYNSKDATDAMELGVNQYLLNDSDIDFTTREPETVKSNIEKLNGLLYLIPTQTKRTDEMVELQQFSTPPTIAYISSWLADITSGDTVLEPSAGIGGLAVFGKIAGAKVYVNEYSKRRAEVIKEMGFDQVFTEDGEQIDNILPDKVKPTVVIMNPPFSAAGQRMAAGKTSTMNATKHIEQALNRLEPGGRLVAIVGKGMADNAPMFKKWWDSIKAEYNVRANVGIDGRNYTKYGTSFDIQMFIIDKTGITDDTVTAEVRDLDSLVDLLGGIANDRQEVAGGNEQAEPTANKSDSDEASGESQGSDRRRGHSHKATDDVGDRQPKGPDKGSRGEPGQPGKIKHGTDIAGVESEVDNGTLDKSGEPGETSKATDGETGTSSGISDRTNTINNGRKGTGVQDGKRLDVKTDNKKVKQKDLGDSIYDEYAPQKLKIKGAKPHPGILAQSAAMAAVEPPTPTYSPKLPKNIVTEGKLSLAQLETVVYAGQAHEQMFENGQRKGFFIGDGTGVGKGRQISGIILDNNNQGRKKSIWISVNDKLFPDAQRDWSDLGGKPEDVFLLNKTKLGNSVANKEGIMFLSYDTLASKLEFSADSELINSSSPSRMKQIQDWFGEDYDGVIVFDEAHKMGNAIELKVKRGRKKPSARGLAGVQLQKLFPKARIVYVSATGATEVSNLAYAERLGLWGRGTEFADKKDFISKITEGGLAAMELVARDMKALGVYIARTLSFDGVKYETLEHELTQDQSEIYDTLAEAWQIVLQNINKALETTGATDDGKTLNSNAKKNALGAFWGAEQRFFNQILTSMQMPSVIAQMKNDIADGNSVVLQLVNTNQASQDRALSKLDDEDMSLEDLDLTPRDALMQYLEKSFPVQQYEDYTDDNGNRRSRPVVDSNGEPVINKAAQRMKEELMERVGTMKVPDGPLEMILNSFGVDNVAEVTGRTQRVVKVKGKVKLEKRSKLHTEADTNAFMDGKKQILVFSDAGGTGKSYHADLTRKNQKQRIHYLLQAGWRADNAVQGFGRTHRTNQASSPIYRLVTTNLKGHKRFISSIARRLDQLGALTKGQRQTGSQGLFKASDNLEGPLANESLSRFYKDLSKNLIEGLDKKTVFSLMGLNSMLDEYSKINESSQDLRDIPKFLNRILALKTDMQNKVFDAFMERLENYTEAAIANGMLDQGLENYKADKVEIKDEQVVYQDENTGAETKYYELQAFHKNHPDSFSKASNKPSKFIGYFVNKKSGNIRAVYSAGTTTDDYGRVKEAYRLYNPLNNQRMDKWEFDAGNWEEVDTKTAEEEWNKAVAEIPEFKKSTVHLISGTLLPIWSKLPGENMKVIRVLTSDGQILLGRTIHPSQVDMTLRRLGASRNEGEFTPERVIKAILEDNNTAELSNGWKLKRSRVSGEPRIEITGNDLWRYTQQLKEDGVFTETIQYNTRYFIPTNNTQTIGKVTGYWNVIDLIEPDSRVQSSAMTGTQPQMPKGDDSSTLEGKEGAKTVDEIVSIIEKVIGVPIRTGKFRQRAHGIFKQLPEVIRTKVTNDLPTIAHEAGHYLDKLYDLAQNQFDAELQALGKVTSRKSYTKEQIRAEGVAEFTRLYLTDPQQATLKAPKFMAHFESSVNATLLKDLNDLRREIGKANNLPPTQKILNDISVGESRKSTKELSISGFLQKLYDAWVDEFAPITRAYRRAVSEGWTGKDVSTMAQIYRGLEARTRSSLKDAQTDLEGKVIGESLESILKPIRKHYKEFITYMVSRRAVDYEDKNFVMPQPYWVYQDNVVAMEAKYSHFKDVFDNLRKWEDNNLHLLVESGIKTEASIDDIKANNPNHVPLYRIQEAMDKVRAGSGNTLGQSKKVIRRAKGSGKTIIDPIESIIADAFIIRRAAEANNILRALADMADSTEGFGDVMEAVPPGIRGTTFNVEEISKALEDMGIDIEGVDLDKLVTIFRANYSERANEVTVFRNGKSQLYQMESEIYKAIKGLHRQASHFLIRALNVPKKIIQAGAVTTVQFVMRNIARDTGTSLINSEAGINPIDIIKGYASAIKKDKWFKQWVRTGGASEFIQVADRTNAQDLEADILGINFVDKIKELLSNPTKENAMRVLLSPMRAIREGIEWSEAGPRIAEMRKATEKGVSQDTAAAWSRDLSQDFLRHGYYGKELNKITAFFNANVQGIEKQIRTFKAHPYRTLVRGLIYVTVPTMILYFINDDNEEYKRMAEWRKALFYNIPLGDRKTTSHFLSIPKPYGWGYIFGALPETILDEIRRDEPDTWKKVKEGFAINFDVPLMPSAVGPSWEVATNKSWNKTPIESQGDKNKPAYLRYNDRTSSTSRTIANVAKGVAPISPKQLDYMVKGYTGPVGDFFWRLPDTIKKGIQAPDDYTNYPVVKSFITDTVYSNDTIDSFYNYGTELEDRRKEAQETGSYQPIKHLSETVQNELTGSLRNARLEYNHIADSFSDARKRINEINGSSEYGPSQKKVMTREIQVKMIKMAETYNKKYEQFKKKYDIK